MGCMVYTLPACYPETVAELSQVRDRSDPAGASPVSGEPSAAFPTSRRGGHRRRRPGRRRRPTRRSRRTRRRLGQTVTANPRAPPPSTAPRITPGDAPGRLRNNPPDEEDPPEQTATATFTPHAFKATPRITFRRSGSIRAFATDLDKRRRCGHRDGQHGSRRRPLGATDAETCTSHSKAQFQPSFSSAKCTPRTQNAHLDEEGAGRPGGSREGGRIPHSGRHIPKAAPRARRTARSSLRRPSRHRPSRRRNPTRSRRRPPI